MASAAVVVEGDVAALPCCPGTGWFQTFAFSWSPPPSARGSFEPRSAGEVPRCLVGLVGGLTLFPRGSSFLYNRGS